MAEGSEEIEIDGRRFELSNPDKLLFPEAGVAKRDLCEYYRRMASNMLPFLEGRSITMQRFPDGVKEDGFYQKEAPDYFPDWIERAVLSKEDGEVTYVVVNDAASLVYLAGQACVTFHVALAPVSSPRSPDRLVFDLDPSGDDFTPVREGALRLRAMLDEEGLAPFCKTTGSRGLHVEAPLDGSADFDAARRFARGLAERLADEAPDLFTVAHRKADRGGRVFIDTLRNAYGQTTAAPYSVRALPGAPVAAPLAWREVEDASLSAQAYSIGNVFRRLGQIDDPWRGFAAAAAPISTGANDP